ncbi:hypothetical protein GGQ68_000821 [Sagittula marina]|uniref:Uncharacterized protein n=2 Tax=Sagittula marina TaxID=943940 RepID=A0A7W6DJP4_9RHOB|nr:hypothetical protein [Sagittula marina]
MEPFRPLVNCTVHRLPARHGTQVNTQAKQELARLIALDLPLAVGQSPVSVALSRLAISLGQRFETGKLAMALPRTPDALMLAGLGG